MSSNGIIGLLGSLFNAYKELPPNQKQAANQLIFKGAAKATKVMGQAVQDINNKLDKTIEKKQGSMAQRAYTNDYNNVKAKKDFNNIFVMPIDNVRKAGDFIIIEGYVTNGKTKLNDDIILDNGDSFIRIRVLGLAKGTVSNTVNKVKDGDYAFIYTQNISLNGITTDSVLSHEEAFNEDFKSWYLGEDEKIYRPGLSPEMREYLISKGKL